jgi:hypothetical protein
MRLAKIYHPKIAHSLFILPLVLFSISAWAESVQVEAIFFRHLNVPKTELRYQVSSNHLSLEPRSFSPQEQDQDLFGLGYTKIHALEHVRLHPHFESLFQSKAYQVLFYQAWHQPLIAPSRALLIPLTTNATPHIQATLQVSYTQGIEAQWAVTLLNPNDMEQSVSFTEKRLIRLDDLQYFDHPMVGLLLKVRSIPKDVNEIHTPAPTTPVTPTLSSPNSTQPPTSPNTTPATTEEPATPPLIEVPVEPDSEAHD